MQIEVAAAYILAGVVIAGGAWFIHRRSVQRRSGDGGGRPSAGSRPAKK
jgi:hypothetical protein